jgi:hypothetical protein
VKPVAGKAPKLLESRIVEFQPIVRVKHRYGGPDVMETIGENGVTGTPRKS